MTRLSDEELEAAMNHQRYDADGQVTCVECDEPWPCDYMMRLELLMRLSMIRRAVKS